jgi:hypothetical protein
MEHCEGRSERPAVDSEFFQQAAQIIPALLVPRRQTGAGTDAARRRTFNETGPRRVRRGPLFVTFEAHGAQVARHGMP